MSDFHRFMNGLRNDARLGHLFHNDLAKQEPEVIVLTLAGRLADAIEGKQPHPAHELLERLAAGR